MFHNEVKHLWSVKAVLIVLMLHTFSAFHEEYLLWQWFSWLKQE